MRIYRTESNVVFEYLYQVYKTMLRESRQDIWTMVYRMCKGGGISNIYDGFVWGSEIHSFSGFGYGGAGYVNNLSVVAGNMRFSTSSFY